MRPFAALAARGFSDPLATEKPSILMKLRLVRRTGFRFAGPCACGLAIALGGCTVDLGGFSFVDDKSASVRIDTQEAVLGPDGRCEADASIDPAVLRARPRSVEPGISECDLVRLKGEPADVLIGDNGKGQREVQVLYQEPTGKKLYLFADNRLSRVVD